MFGITLKTKKNEPKIKAEEPTVAPAKPKNTLRRPKIGLALGSGVARGWAHIGILRRLEEEGIKIDFIAGTSVGAVVGGAYAAGALDELETWTRKLGSYSFFKFLDFKFTGGGLFGGNSLNQLMQLKFGEKDFKELNIPFTAVACELKTGHEIWLDEGKISDAIQASFAMPGVFEPVNNDNRWLVDGALVNPVPVSACRAAGCEMVIAVNLSEDLYGRVMKTRKNTSEYGIFQEIVKTPSSIEYSKSGSIFRKLFSHKGSAPSLFANMVASLNILQNRLARSRMAGDPPDVTISPRCGHIGLMEFNRAEELIEEGVIAFDENLSKLQDALEIITHRMNT